MINDLHGSRRNRVTLSLLSGGLLALAMAPISFWFAVVPAFQVVAWLFLTARSRKQAAWTGWFFGTAYFAVSLNWIVEPFLVDPVRYAWMAPFALVFMAGGLALFWMVAFYLAGQPKWPQGFRLSILICTWSLAEFARAYVLTGFPWAGFAQFWVDDYPGQLLAWIGPQGLSVATLLAFLLPGLALMGQASRMARFASLLPVVLFLALSVEVGERRQPTHLTELTVRLVQPNAPQHQKWDPEYMRVFFDRQIAFTAADPRPDLVVWPETAIPTLLHNAGPTFEVIADAAQGAPVALGVQRIEQGRFFNSLVVLDADGSVAARYDKHHLVPFGEYVPLGDLAARVGLSGFATKDGNGFSPGPGPQLIQFGDLGKGVPLICYEAVFPQFAGATAERPDFLIQITNDAWFGTRSGPYQHLVQARMRAIEQGVPLIRSANTGISAMIGPYGEITAQIALGTADFADAELPAALPPTLYSRTGDWPVLFILLAAGLGLAAGLRAKRSRK